MSDESRDHTAQPMNVDTDEKEMSKLNVSGEQRKDKEGSDKGEKGRSGKKRDRSRDSDKDSEKRQKIIIWVKVGETGKVKSMEVHDNSSLASVESEIMRLESEEKRFGFGEYSGGGIPDIDFILHGGVELDLDSDALPDNITRKKPLVLELDLVSVHCVVRSDKGETKATMYVKKGDTVDNLKKEIRKNEEFRHLLYENGEPVPIGGIKWDPDTDELARIGEPLPETYYECKDGDFLDSFATLTELGVNAVNTNRRNVGASPVVVIVKSTTILLNRFPSYGTLKTNVDYISLSQIFSYREETVDELYMLILSSQNLMITSPTFTGKTTLCSLLQQKISSRGLLTRSLNMIDCFRNTTINFMSRLTTLFGLDMEKYLLSYDNGEEVPSLCLIIDEVQMTYVTTDALGNDTTEEAKLIVDNFGEDSDITLLDYEENRRLLEMVAYNNVTSADIKRLIDVASINIILLSAYGSGKGHTEISTPYRIPSRKYDTGKFKPLEMKGLLESFNSRSVSRNSYQFSKGDAFDKIMKMTGGHVGYTFTILDWLCGKYLTCDEDVLLYLGSYSLYQLLLGARASPDNTEVEDKTLTPYLLSMWTRKSIVYPCPDEKLSTGLNRLVRRGLIEIQNDSSYELFCPLSVQIWLMNLFPQQGIPKDNYGDHDIEDFCWDVLRLISPPELAKTNSKTAELIINESIWQAEFYCHAKSLLQRDTLLSVEVSEIEENRSTGRVDFHVNGTKHWGIELLIEGHKSFTPKKKDDFMIRLKKKRGEMNRLAEHYHRINGKYEIFNFNHYLVIDFRQREYTEEETYDNDLEHIWIVYYQPDSETGTVVTIGKRGDEPEVFENFTFGHTLHTIWHELI